ncbi:MAG: type IV secretion system DNA-binding domain-containing protein [bacterium]|nr:type IV secretion system DNA-binding domain-containing protein [bacterium]
MIHFLSTVASWFSIAQHPIIATVLWIAVAAGLVILIAHLIEWHYNAKRSLDMIFLKVTVPKKEGKDEKEAEGEQFGTSKDYTKQIGIMTQCLEALHTTSSEWFWYRFIAGQDFFSFEIVATEGQIHFYMVVPYSLKRSFQKTISSFYNDALIEEVEEYNLFKPGCKAFGRYMKQRKHYCYPIKTYAHIHAEPMNALLNSMSKLGKDDSAAIQIVIRPRDDGWQEKSKKMGEEIFMNKKPGSFLSKFNPINWFKIFFKIFAVGTDDNLSENFDSNTGSTRTTPQTDEMVKSIGEKASYTGWDSVIRVVATSKSASHARDIVEVIRNAFGQFDSPYLNAFERVRYFSLKFLLINFIYRSLWRNWTQRLSFRKMVLSSDEIATMWHVPAAKYNDVPNVAWQRFKITGPPDNLPHEGDIMLGYNLHRGERADVWMQQDDRFRHLYLIGQTGTGKSVFLEQLIKQDIRNGKGICVVDPHGDLVEAALSWVPRERADDVIVFDPADTERPMGVNMLEADTPEERDFVALEAMNMMVGMFGNEVFGPRIQDYFRNGCLTLMEDPGGGALTDIVRLFTDEPWQQEKVKHIKNPIVKSFWVNQMAQTGEREKKEMIPYFAAKFGCFITNSLMRNIIGQTKSAFRFDDVMDSGKILLVKLAKGLVGDINSNLLGMIFVNKIQVAAMKRQRIADKTQRKPFFLYVDEFQNFITDSFESILSEARKYKLGLIIGHQYIDQLIKGGAGKGGGESEKVKNAVFGNVGTMLNFKIGAKDAEYIAKEMGPVFTETDVINLEGFNTCIKLNINNQISRPFSMKTVKWWEETPEDKPDKEVAEALIQLSRLKYGREKEFVSREVIRRIGANVDSAKDSGPASNPLGI